MDAVTGKKTRISDAHYIESIFQGRCALGQNNYKKTPKRYFQSDKHIHQTCFQACVMNILETNITEKFCLNCRNSSTLLYF